MYSVIQTSLLSFNDMHTLCCIIRAAYSMQQNQCSTFLPVFSQKMASQDKSSLFKHDPKIDFFGELQIAIINVM